MVMEFCPGGELFSTIRKQPYGRLTEAQVHFYASEVVLVLEYIHSRGYIYRGTLHYSFSLYLAFSGLILFDFQFLFIWVNRRFKTRKYFVAH